jgi:putative transposase
MHRCLFQLKVEVSPITMINNPKTVSHKGYPNRKSIRLKGYDYSKPGAYFITIVTQNRACLFGEIINGQMVLNDAGIMVDNEWVYLPNRFANLQLDEYIIMPNHFHAILEIVPPVGATLVVARNANNTRNDTHANNTRNDIHKNDNTATNIDKKGQPYQKGQPQGIAPTAANNTLGDVVGAFQSIVTVKYICGVKTKKWQQFDKKLWQRNYWDHIVRNKMELNNIRQYIQNNPKNWRNDKLHGGIGNSVMEDPVQYGEDLWML